jgi:MbtH protein
VADEETDTRLYTPVINQEEQYSIWPADEQPPEGWRIEGEPAPRQQCLAYIDQVWTDMRPLSLRIAMGAERANGAHEG